MLVHQNNGVRQTGKLDTPINSEDSTSRQFTVQMADELLRTTGQYDRWSEIRKNDPARAEQIAQIVMDRHSYVAGETTATEADRAQFDQLTEALRNEGIFLYKSDQFKDPIFSNSGDGAVAQSSAKTVASESSGQDNSQAGARAQTAGREERVASAQTNEGGLSIQKLQRQFAHKDCLEFVAGVLEEKGISYYGKDGLAGELIAMARTQGKNPYSLLTGEGVTKLLSDNPVTISVTDAQLKSADEIYNELEPHLKAGAILSYSSNKFGHTGIVNRKDGQWMYVNSSGLSGVRSSYRVLEEDLKSEISGWLRRANKNDTFLNITLGAVDTEKASAYGSRLLSSRSTNYSAINLLA